MIETNFNTILFISNALSTSLGAMVRLLSQVQIVKTASLNAIW